jgi:hypothetical protein
MLFCKCMKLLDAGCIIDPSFMPDILIIKAVGDMPPGAGGLIPVSACASAGNFYSAQDKPL